MSANEDNLTENVLPGDSDEALPPEDMDQNEANAPPHPYASGSGLHAGTGAG